MKQIWLEMASEAVNQTDPEDTTTDEDSAANDLTLKKLQEGLKLSWKSRVIFLKNADPSAERRRKFKRELQNCVSPNKENLQRPSKNQQTK